MVQKMNLKTDQKNENVTQGLQYPIQFYSFRTFSEVYIVYMQYNESYVFSDWSAVVC